MKYQRNPQATATICLVVWLCVLVVSTEAFKSSRHVHMVPSRKAPAPPLFMVQYDDDDSNKFGFGQRIESLKSFVVGALTGSLTLAPIVGVHDVVFRNHGLAQFEFDSDTAALEAGLFAMVYRYCIRTDDNNPQLGQGVVGAFALTRTCSRIVVPSYCTAIPLNCKKNRLLGNRLL